MKLFSSVLLLLIAQSFFTLPVVMGGPVSPERSGSWIYREFNGIAAKVEGRIITYGEIRREIAPFVSQIQRRARTQEEFDRMLNQQGRDVLQSLIDRILIVNEFREAGMQIPRAYVESELNNVIANEFDGNRSRFHQFLQARDLTVRQYREELEERIMVQAMRQRLRRSLAEVSPERIESFYRENQSQFVKDPEVRLRQIILTPRNGESPDEVSDLAWDLHGLLERGAEFAELAREHSRDEMARQGGDWGWMRKRDLRTELAEVAFQLEEGDFSEPIQVGPSFFILYADEVRSGGLQPLADVRGQIEQLLSEKFSRQVQRRWIERIRENAFIEIYI